MSSCMHTWSSLWSLLYLLLPVRLKGSHPSSFLPLGATGFFESLLTSLNLFPLSPPWTLTAQVCLCSFGCLQQRFSFKVLGFKAGLQGPSLL